ncbi:MAG: translation initiation factor IF-2 [Thermoplasmata archaeon]|nr:MAG: translation initiation factor IF-2 [Thermoplasmata archaeon]
MTDKIRQPIVSILGHVDHGKTTLLDYIRGTSVADREAGRITQHIGATEVPLDTIYELCGPLLKGTQFKIPGLLFIDTPGHYAFTALRSRGGTLADLAILIIDFMEGFKPQTQESLEILKRSQTPFMCVLNKIDRINGWEVHPDSTFIESYNAQTTDVQEVLDDGIFKIVGQFFDLEFDANRYDKVKDFSSTVTIVPSSAKTGEGVPEVLMVLIGLAQKFLEEQLHSEEGAGEGTILEVKEEKGLGTTIDTIIYNGTINQGDTIVVGTSKEPLVTKIKALLKPKPLDEIRDPRERFDSVKSVSAAAGVKISAQNLEGVLAGAPVNVCSDATKDGLIESIAAESKCEITACEDGLVLKADAIGSLEALIFELKQKEIPIKKVEVGDISKRDLVDTSCVCDPLRRVLLGFNVKILPEAKEELEKSGEEITIFTDNVIYKLIERYEQWFEKKQIELDKASRGEIVYPGKFKVLPDYIFRVSKPAVVGVRVLAGRLRVGQGILRDDGRVIGKIQSIQQEKKSLKEAKMGDEVAIAISKVTVGRQINGDDILYVDIPEAHVRTLREQKLSFDETEILEKVCEIKRKEKFSWGM